MFTGGFLLFLAIFTLAFWVLLFLATFALPFAITAYITNLIKGGKKKSED